jgi:hypothetical protein
MFLLQDHLRFLINIITHSAKMTKSTSRFCGEAQAVGYFVGSFIKNLNSASIYKDFFNICRKSK